MCVCMGLCVCVFVRVSVCIRRCDCFFKSNPPPPPIGSVHARRAGMLWIRHPGYMIDVRSWCSEEDNRLLSCNSFHNCHHRVCLHQKSSKISLQFSWRSFLLFFYQHMRQRGEKEKNMYIIPVRSNEQSKSPKVVQQVEQVSSRGSSHLLF